MQKLLSGAILLAMGLAGAVHAQEKPGFPRLGGYKIGAPQDYESAAKQEALSGLDLIVLNNFPGWETAHGTTMEKVAKGIKSRNPQAKVFTYVNVNEVATTGDAWQSLRDKLDKQKWWLYPAGTSGTPVPSSWAGAALTNFSLAAPADSNGDRYVDWYSKWAYSQYFQAAPSIDGSFTDNFFLKPRKDGDWNRDGVSDAKSSSVAVTLNRAGLRRHVEGLRGLMPKKYQLGNISEFGNPDATYPEFAGLLQGGVLEHFIGETWSPEGRDWEGTVNNWGSWAEMMRRYRKAMSAVAEPKLVIFNQLGDPSDYQSMRYGLTSTMMDDAYFDFSDATGKMYSSVPWFDEYDAELGQALSSPPTAAWKSGVYRRDFENGIALVNPRGNGSVTVDLGEEFRRIPGTQVPAVNNGQLATKITLKDRDGIILLRKNAVYKPHPPSSFKVE